MNVFYISYDGVLDPLGSSQIVPYLVTLHKKGIRYTLLTFEKKDRLKNQDEVSRLKSYLGNNGVNWKFLIYHKRPSVPATLFDMLCAISAGLLIVIREKIDLIHVRSFVGIIPGFILAKILKIKFLYDSRGFYAHERVDGNLWKKNGILFKVTQKIEYFCLSHSDWIICLTETAKDILEKDRKLEKIKNRITVIPTCADLKKFNIFDKNPDLLKKLNLEDRFIFIYSGSIGTWYMLDEMFDFFKTAKKINNKSFFLFLTPFNNLVQLKAGEKLISEKDYLIEFLPYEQMHEWLSLADAAISFIKPTFSKKSSCPTKFGESLASGLPVVINQGVGDTDKYVKENNLGAVIQDFNIPEYEIAAKKIFSLLESNNHESSRKRCRQIAQDFFSLESAVEKYYRIYREICR